MEKIAKNKRATHQRFESATSQGKFVKICHDMMNSKAWQELKPAHRYLYLELKAKYTAKVSAGVLISDNRNDISFTKAEGIELFGNATTFFKGMDALIAHGFIRLVSSGWNTRTCNIYGFSERWQKFGTPDFYVPDNEKRMPRKKETIAN